MHELYVAYVDAGFTRTEAIQLLVGSITGARGGQP
jgi:hypothetical protein